MKRKLLFLVSLLTASMVLSACGGGAESGDDNGGDNGGGNSLTLNGTMEEAVNKLYQLGQSQGFEITFNAESNDDEGQESYSETVGFKSNVLWIKEQSAYKKVDTNIESYSYDQQKRSYEFNGEYPESLVQYSLDQLLKQFTAEFYIGYNLANNQQLGSITAVKPTTYLGRNAMEYTFAYGGVDGAANVNIIFDNDTGITMKIAATAVAGGESSSGMFEITSFKVGSDVTVPTLNKSSGGQGGEGGEGEVTGDVFSNKLLMYDSNSGASLYANSQLALFADGKFEFKFLQSGYQIVMFGSFTISADKASATLVVNKVYKDQDKQLSDMNATFVLSYVSGAYALAVSGNGTVYFVASGDQPSHYVLPGQGGGETDVENFVNHFFTYVSQQNAPDFVNSTVALFDDATFEVVTIQNGSLLVYLGTYTVNASDTAATLSVTKYYSAASGAYTERAVGNWIFTLQQNNYMLSMAGGPTVYYALSSEAPVHADIPADSGQTVDDPKYQVNAALWGEMIVNYGLVSMTSNFTLESPNTSPAYKFEFDNGKIRCESTHAYNGTSQSSVSYFEYTSLTNGFGYFQNSDGKWVKQSPIDEMHAFFDDYIGTLPISFEKVTYNSDSHYYGCSRWTTIGADGAQDTYENLRFYFENGNLIKATYKHWDVEYEYNYSKHGQTVVTLPQVDGGQSGQGGEGGQTTDENARFKITSTVWDEMILDAGLVSLDSNFTAMVRSSDMSGQNKYEFDNGKIHSVANDGYEYYHEYTRLDRGYSYYVDNGVWYKADYTYGISSFMNTLGLLGCQFSELTFNAETHEYQLRSLKDPYSDSVYATGIAISFVDGKLMKFSYTRNGIYHETEFGKYGETSVTLPEVGSSAGGQGQGGEGGEGQQTTSKWPAEDIAALLKRLEINATLPALSDETNVESVNPTIPADNSGLLITVTYSDARYAFSQLFSYIDSDNASFNMDYARSNFSGDDPYAYILVYLNETSDVMVTLSVNQTNKTFIIQVSKFSLPTYPAEDIAKYFEENELENVLPSLEMDNVSYQFSYGTLMMSAKGENTNENIIKGAVALLLKAGFKTMYLDDDDSDAIMPVYVHPSFEYYVGFMEMEGDVWAFIYPCIYLADYTFLSYPNDIISSTRPEDFKDSLPSFDIGECVYSFHEGFDGGYELRIHLQEGMSAERMMTTLTQRLARGFTVDDDGVYTSTNGEIFITFENVQDSIIKVVINYNLEEEPPIEEEPVDVEYTLVWDKGSWTKPITDGDAKIYAYVWDNENNHEWIELTPILGEDGTYYFNLTVSNTWTGVKIVRFAPESDIDWQKGDDGSINEGVEIWNESGNYELNGKGGVITFVVRQLVSV